MKLKEKNNILMNLANHTEKSVLMPENPVTLDNPDGIYLYRGSGDRYLNHLLIGLMYASGRGRGTSFD